MTSDERIYNLFVAMCHLEAEKAHNPGASRNVGAALTLIREVYVDLTETTEN